MTTTPQPKRIVLISKQCPNPEHAAYVMRYNVGYHHDGYTEAELKALLGPEPPRWLVDEQVADDLADAQADAIHDAMATDLADTQNDASYSAGY